MQFTSFKYGAICLLALLLLGGTAGAQGVKADAGNVLPMRRAPELTALVDAKTPGCYAIHDQTQTIREEAQVIVNFEKEMLLAAVLGARPTGDTVSITGVRELADRVVAIVEEHHPGKGYALTTVITYPLDVVAVPKSDKPVYFIVNHYVGAEKTGTTSVFPILRLITGRSSKVEKAANLVITDEQSWQNLWLLTGATPPDLTVDFTRQMAVAIFRGNGSNDPKCPPYRIATDVPYPFPPPSERGSNLIGPLSVTSDGKHLIITYHYVERITDDTALHTSYLIAIIPASHLPVIFHPIRDNNTAG